MEADKATVMERCPATETEHRVRRLKRTKRDKVRKESK